MKYNSKYKKVGVLPILLKRISIIRKSEIGKSEIRDPKIRVVILAFGIFGALGRVISSVAKMAANGSESESSEGELDNEVCIYQIMAMAVSLKVARYS